MSALIKSYLSLFIVDDAVVLFGLVESIKDYNTLLRLVGFKALRAPYSWVQSCAR